MDARLLFVLPLSLLLVAACAPSAGSSASPTPPPLADGAYAYHPTPYIWETVRIQQGDAAGGSGSVFEWNCAGQQWAIGRIPVSVHATYLQFGDERFAIANGTLDARWQRTDDPDPRRGASLVCTDPMPTTKAVMSTDGARELIANKVSDIAPALVPTALPDQMSAIVDVHTDSYAVLYVGDAGVRVWLRTAVVQLPRLEPDGFEQRMAFRGDAAALYRRSDGRETATRTLIWFEPASKPSGLVNACRCVPYAITADGLTEVEFWKVVQSLR